LLKSVKHFTEDDSSSPNVHLLAVVFFHKYQFWRPVKPSSDMTCKLPVQVLPQVSRLQQNLADLSSFQLSNIKRDRGCLRQNGLCLRWLKSRYVANGCSVDAKIWPLRLFDRCFNPLLLLLGFHLVCLHKSVWRGLIRETKHLVLSEEFIHDVVLADNTFKLTSKSEVANFDSAVLHDQQISWLDITMNHVGRMDVFQATKQVIENGFDMAL